MAGGRPRFFQTVDIRRPTIDAKGDAVVPASGTAVSGAIWTRRRKAIQAGTGEILEVTAIGFLPSGTDVARRDRIILASGQTAGPHEFEVVTVIPAHDDRGRTSHVGVELRDPAEATNR